MEAEATLAFMRQLSRESNRNLVPPSLFEGISVKEEETYLESMVSHAHNFTLSAWAGGVIVGSTHVITEAGFSCHVGEIGLGVLDSYRGLGLGRLLTNHLIALAEQNEISNLILRVRTFNEPAIRLYESVGFKRVGTLVGVALLPDEPPADEYIYQRLRAAKVARPSSG
jgi:ribosomal protein S18 acetylase RimI-like enzyme